MSKQISELEKMVANFRAFRHHLPDVGEAYDCLPAEAHKDGVLSGKVKRLMALSAALTHGCKACILYQAEEALKLGASVEEILESCAVAMSLGGTMAAGETPRVMEYLQEKGLV